MSGIDALQRASHAFGGPSALAYALGRSPQDVSNLLHGRHPIPIALAVEVEVLTGGAIRAAELRPDLRVWFEAFRHLAVDK